jgi:RsiW-degrading membrane proteinase PrsW (M82 family)
MGVWYGLAKKFDLYGNDEKANRYCKLAVLFPVLLHGSYDFIASMENSWFTLVFIVFIAVMFWISLHMVKQQAKRDHYLDGVSYKSVIR